MLHEWIYKHLAEIKFTPITIMVEGNTFFEEFIINAKLFDGSEVQSRQAEVLIYDNFKVKILRIYFDRLDFSNAVAKGWATKKILKYLIRKSIDGLE